MDTKHTATPWHYKQLVGVTERGFGLFSTDGARTLRLDRNLNGEFSESDAAFIVRAVNSHQALIDALQKIADKTIDSDSRRTATAALAQVKEGKA